MLLVLRDVPEPRLLGLITQPCSGLSQVVNVTLRPGERYDAQSFGLPASDRWVRRIKGSPAHLPRIMS
jgi:hypothetical protein